MSYPLGDNLSRLNVGVTKLSARKFSQLNSPLPSMSVTVKVRACGGLALQAYMMQEPMTFMPVE